MMVYTVYDAEGNIRQILKGSVPDPIELMGCEYIEGYYPPEEFRIENGEPVPK